MTVDHIRYDLLAQEALRSVVRRVLTDVAKTGLPGDHHFFISFDTRAPGVRLSHRMKEKYPEEMTIVLQHQFWDLIVTETSFEVGLSFGGIPERLLVPFSALKGFFDPSVKFGLQFETLSVDADGEETDDASLEAPLSANTSDFHAPGANAPSPLKPAPGAASEPTLASATTAAQGEDKPGGGAQVVQLDVFRNKK